MSAPRSTPSVSPLLLEAGFRNAFVDRVTAEMSRAFAARGIPSIVLKGPAIAQWLYEADEVRTYGDSDFLIPHEHWDLAGSVLREEGFQNLLVEMAHPRMQSHASDGWERRGVDNVDLHSTVYGIR